MRSNEKWLEERTIGVYQRSNGKYNVQRIIFDFCYIILRYSDVVQELVVQVVVHHLLEAPRGTCNSRLQQHNHRKKLRQKIHTSVYEATQPPWRPYVLLPYSPQTPCCLKSATLAPVATKRQGRSGAYLSQKVYQNEFAQHVCIDGFSAVNTTLLRCMYYTSNNNWPQGSGIILSSVFIFKSQVLASTAHMIIRHHPLHRPNTTETSYRCCQLADHNEGIQYMEWWRVDRNVW